MAGDLSTRVSEFKLDVRQIDTIKVVEHIKNITIYKEVSKEIEVPKYREVIYEKPVIVTKTVTTEKVKVNDVTAAVVKAATEAVVKLIQGMELKVTGDGTVKMMVK